MKPESIETLGEKIFQRAEAERRRWPRRALASARRGQRRLARGRGRKRGVASAAWQRARLVRLSGHCLRALGRHEEAVRAYASADALFRSAGDRVEAARCGIGTVDALMYLGRYEAAERAGSAALRVLERRGDPAGARLLNNLANLEYRRDRPERALALYARARPALAALGPSVLGRVDANRSNCLAVRGHPQEAERMLRSARRAFVEAGLPVDAAACDYALAYLLFLRHRYIDALFALDALDSQFERLEARDFQVLLEIDAAEILLRLGRPEEAELGAARAAELAESLGLRYERSKAVYFEAVAMAERGDLVAARRLLHEARRGFTVERNRVWAAQCDLALAECDLEARRAPAAQVRARRAAAAFRREGDVEREGLAWVLAGRAALASGRAAGSSVSLARRSAQRAQSAFLAFRVACLEGDVAFRARRMGDARRAYRRAARLSDSLAGRIRTELFRAADWTAWEDAYPRLVALELAAGRTPEAFHALERGRARAFELVRETGAGRIASRGVSAVIARRLEGLSCRLESRRWRRAALPATPASGFSPRAQEERETVRLIEKLERQARRARGARAIAPVHIERVREALAPGERLVEFFEVEGLVNAVAVGRDDLVLHSRLAKRAEVDGWLEEIAYLARAGARHGAQAASAIADALREASARLVSPWMLGASPPSQVVVVPAGRMAQLPWPAMVREAAGRPIAVCASPSASAWRELSSPGRWSHRSGATVLVEAGSDKLPETEHEIEEISRLFPKARVLTKRDARVDRVRRALVDAEWLHVAGHGRADSERPILSGVRLADRWAHVTDLMPGGRAPRGVVLSACRTGELVGGWRNEWRGLAGSLLASGSQAVVASLWDAEDASARQWSGALYGQLRAGADLGTALARSQEEFRGRGDSGWNAWTWGLFGASRAWGP